MAVQISINMQIVLSMILHSNLLKVLLFEFAIKSIALPVFNVDRSFIREAKRKWKKNRRRNWLCDWRVFPKDKEMNSSSVTLPNNKPILAMCITTDSEV